MKRFITILLTLAMIAVLGACSKVEIPNKRLEETTDYDVKEESEQSKGEISDVATLSDDIYSFQVEINGDLYQFPMKYTDFINYGWTYQDEDTENVDSNYNLRGTFVNGLICFADIYNFDINARPVKECYITGITINTYSEDRVGDFTLRLPKGLEFGKATVKDIKNAYGKPTDTYHSKYDTRLTYQLDNYQEVEISVSKENGTISKVVIENVLKPKDFVEGEASTEVPEIVKKYKTPDKLGDNLSEFIVEYGGDLYQIPAPVSSFISNGWELDETDTGITVTGRGHGFVTLIKDDQRLEAKCINYCEDATSIENCFVTNVESGVYENDTNIVISQNLTIGSSVSDLEKAIVGVEHEKSTSSDTDKYYRIMPGESILDSYNISVEEGTIDRIKIKNAPGYSKFTK